MVKSVPIKVKECEQKFYWTYCCCCFTIKVYCTSVKLAQRFSFNNFCFVLFVCVLSFRSDSIKVYYRMCTVGLLNFFFLRKYEWLTLSVGFNLLFMLQYIESRAFQLKSIAGRTPIGRVIRRAAWSNIPWVVYVFWRILTKLHHISNSRGLIKPKYRNVLPFLF